MLLPGSHACWLMPNLNRQTNRTLLYFPGCEWVWTPAAKKKNKLEGDNDQSMFMFKVFATKKWLWYGWSSAINLPMNVAAVMRNNSILCIYLSIQAFFFCLHLSICHYSWKTPTRKEHHKSQVAGGGARSPIVALLETDMNPPKWRLDDQVPHRRGTLLVGSSY